MVIKKNTKPVVATPAPKPVKAVVEQVKPHKEPPVVVVNPDKVTKKALAVLVQSGLKEQGKAAPTSLLEAAIDVVFAQITNAVASGNQVFISGFGSFQPVHKDAAVRHNPRNPEEKIQVPASLAIKFKPAKGLKDTLNS